MNTSLKILIIDDNIADSTLLKRLFNRLKLWEITLEIATSGDEGIEVIKTLNYKLQS